MGVALLAILLFCLWQVYPSTEITYNAWLRVAQGEHRQLTLCSA